MSGSTNRPPFGVRDEPQDGGPELGSRYRLVKFVAPDPRRQKKDQSNDSRVWSSKENWRGQVEDVGYVAEARCNLAQLAVGDSRNAITLARSSADVSPPNGFMLLPGTTSSGFAMKRSSFSLSHTKSAPFMALE